MTHNQIEYWKTREAERSNRAKERETRMNNRRVAVELARHNLAMEREQERSNLANEGLKQEANAINLQGLEETKRHQQAVEAETNRANVAKETEAHSYNTSYISEWANQAANALTETVRSHKAQEYNTQRYNQAYAQIGSWTASTNQQNADTREYEADIAQQRQDTYLLSTLLNPNTSGQQGNYLDSMSELNEQKVSESQTNVRSRKLHDVLDTLGLIADTVNNYQKNVSNAFRGLSLFKGGN